MRVTEYVYKETSGFFHGGFWALDFLSKSEIPPVERILLPLKRVQSFDRLQIQGQGFVPDIFWNAVDLKKPVPSALETMGSVRKCYGDAQGIFIKISGSRVDGFAADHELCPWIENKGLLRFQSPNLLAESG
jgi:hypothetical protein